MTRGVFAELLRRPAGIIVLMVLALFYFIAIFADFLAPYGSTDQDLRSTFHPPTALFWKDGSLHVQRYEMQDRDLAGYSKVEGEGSPIRFFAPGRDYRLFGLLPANRHLFQVEGEDRLYLLGSDQVGRDIFSRLLYGTRISLSIGLLGIAISMCIGFVVGGLAGYFGGVFDNTAMRLTEFLMAIPGLYLLLALRGAFAESFTPTQMFFLIVFILSFIGWSGTARIIRGMTLSLRNRQFVLAAEVMGQSSWMILWKHVLPNVFSFLIVAATISIPGYILGEAALSFLGLGIQDPSVSWGLMLSQAQNPQVFMEGYWWFLMPGLAIFITVISFNVLGDVLRDIVDPRQKFLRG
jgi:peptide/nickel transport system permease protein